MKLLLDTHSFMWWDSESARLSRKALALMKSEENSLLVSVVSLWEIQIKRKIGKLDYDVPLREMIESQQQKSGIIVLPVTLEHIVALDSLPDYHRDPFDRLLIAQASVEQVTLVTHDPVIARYPVQTIW